MRRLLAIALTLSAAVAHAETPRFALAVNNPVMWYPWSTGKTLAVSGYVGVSERVAIRANVASYPIDRWGDLRSTDGYHDGRTTDYGLGVVIYSRRRYAGAFAELGVFRRSTPSYRAVGYYDESYGWKLDWAGRALVGYSWELGSKLWIAAGEGFSVGHETGDDQAYDNVYYQPTKHQRFDHVLMTSEWMFRIGASF